MTRKYNFIYKEGKYVLRYSNPNEVDEPFEIDSDNMLFDTKKFYLYVFSDVKEKMTIEIENLIDEKGTAPEVMKKGERVFKVIVDLCNEITKRINAECFGDIDNIV